MTVIAYNTVIISETKVIWNIILHCLLLNDWLLNVLTWKKILLLCFGD